MIANREEQSIYLKVRADIQSGLKAEVMVQWQPYVIQKREVQNPTLGKGELKIN